MYFKLILLLYLYSLYGLRYVSGVAPSFDASTYAISIDENMPSGTTLNTTYTVTASEAITFSLSGSDAGSFVISTNSVLTTASFDYETKTSYTVTLTVTDASSNTATATLTIAVVNLNDNAPVCPNSTIFSTLPENTASGTSIAVQTCTDADGDSVSYSIISGDDVANKFQFASSSSFAMTTTSTPLNYEVKTYYGPLVVHAVDAGSTHTTVVNMYVEVTPVNEFTPVWSSSTTAYSIAEQSALGTTIVTLAATDGDSGSDGVISFTILSATANDASSGTGIFSLDATSGLLVNAQIPQRDSVDGGKQYYDVVVNAMDGGGLSINKTLRITVTNINDETPIFSAKSYLATVIENSATTTSVIQLAATDADPTSTLAYSIVSGNSLAKFAFSSSTPGLLETTSSTIEPDAATSNPVYYELVIMCKDGGSPELNGTASVYISVNLTNDFTPSFGSTVPSGSISVAENTAAAYTVATVSASDNDYGEDGTLSYSIVSGDSDGNFILNSATGVIQISKPIDFETLSVNPIPLVIYCADQSSTSLKNSSLQLPVTVTNVNDNSPICSPMSHVVSLSEIAVSGTLVTTLSCTDADVSDTLTYTLLSGNTGNAFTINNTGSIISASGMSPYWV